MQLDEIAALISTPLFNKSLLARVEMVWALPGQQVDVGKATNKKTISMFNQLNHHVTNLSISQFQFSIQHHTTVMGQSNFFCSFFTSLHCISTQYILHEPPPQVNKWTLPMGGIIHLLGENVSQ